MLAKDWILMAEERKKERKKESFAVPSTLANCMGLHRSCPGLDRDPKCHDEQVEIGDVPRSSAPFCPRYKRPLACLTL